MIDFNKFSAAALALKVKNQEISSFDLVQAHIEKTKKLNPIINAVVETRYEQALFEAKNIDLKIEQLGKKAAVEKLGSFTGVPFSMKEMITVKGMKSTLGSKFRSHSEQTTDATVVERLKASGAIIIGTTNVPEVGFWFETNNRVYGRTNNPYDPSRTSGGSSGGEAALIAAGGVVGGFGSDIGGSIRIPAAFCGIFGHKPSPKLIPVTGHPPIYREDAHLFKGINYPLTVLGPLGRTAKDLQLLMNLMMGPDGVDPETQDFKAFSYNEINLKKLNVFLMKNPKIHLCSETESCLQESVENAGAYLAKAGARVQELDDRLFLKTVQKWFAKLSQNPSRNLQNNLNPLAKVNYFSEIALLPFKQNNHILPMVILGLADVLSQKFGVKKENAFLQSLAELNDLKMLLKDLLTPPAILILPVHPRRAPTHFSPLLRPFDFAPTAIFNALELPATVVPMGLVHGLPTAVQIVSFTNQDFLNLCVAEVLEKAFGGWIPAEPLQNLN